MIISPVLVLATSVDTDPTLVQFRFAIDEAAGFEVPADEDYTVYTAALTPAATQELAQIATDGKVLLEFDASRNVGGPFDGTVALLVTGVRAAGTLSG